MKGERRLSVQDRATLVAWARAGAPLGEPGESSQAQRAVSAAPQPEPDRLLILDPPYRPDMQRQDDYRCFLLDPQLDAETYVTGYRVRPDQAALFHHAILFELGPDAVASAEALDRSEEGPGWTCFGGPGLGDSTASFGFLGFWVPGPQARTSQRVPESCWSPAPG